MTPRLDRRRFLGGFCSTCSALALAGCAESEGRIAPGYKPLTATDEGGLWQMVQKSEEELKTSRFRVREDGIEDYVREVALRLAGDYAGDIRVYLVRTPYFNASMAPNGMMQVWTGLLLRSQNEAQLAAVLGHEIGHYLERHTLLRWRDLRLKTDLAAFAGLGMSAAGLGQFNQFKDILALAAISSFSREQERQADAIGLDLMAKAGYAPLEASAVWADLIEERDKAKDKNDPVFFLQSHPGHEERMETLRAKAAGTSGETFEARWRDRMRPFRRTLLEDELKLRHYDSSLVVLDQLGRGGKEDGELLYYAGEVRRLRDEKDDAGKARETLARALGFADCPPEAHRSLGLLERRRGEAKAANAAFRRYLDLRPNAPDRAMIATYIES
jgi:beta-barrel assembly-enhancing protease